eukprot:gene5515-5569_t
MRPSCRALQPPPDEACVRPAFRATKTGRSMSGSIDHDGGALQAAETTLIASWPPGTFVENLAISAKGDIFATIHNASQIVRITPSGDVSPFASFPVPVAGLAFDDDGTLWASGGTPGSAPGSIWKILPDGTVSPWCEIPHAIFLNGMTLHPDGSHLLVAESLRGQILEIDLKTPAHSVWLEHECLAPRTMGQTPGANGIKVLGGYAYVSVTERDIIVRTDIMADGRPGSIELVAEHIRADDFAPGQDHALYIATHPANSLVRLAVNGRRTTLAGPDEGMAGATAVAFGRTASDSDCVYVTTTGGLFAPIDGVIQPAKLVRVRTETKAI